MKIYIDVGHGGVDGSGTDHGTHGTLNSIVYWENELNLIAAKVCASKLADYGHEVTLSRTENMNVGSAGSYSRTSANIINSASRIKQGDYDLMISMHNNSSSNTDARGYQLIYKTTYGKEAASKQLANCIASRLDKVIKKNAIYYSKDDSAYGILRLHNTVGCIVEGLFMSNKEDLIDLVQNDKLFAIGEATAEGIQLYFGGSLEIQNKKEKENPTNTQYDELLKCIAEISRLTDELASQNEKLKKILG